MPYTVNLINHCKEVLGRIDIFDDTEHLRTFFYGDLGMHRSSLPDSARNPKQRMELCVNFLLKLPPSEDGKPAIVNFIINVLSHYSEEERGIRGQLTELINDFSKEQIETLPGHISKDFIQEHLESLRDKNRANYLDNLFLKNALLASQSVCRLEWHKKGEGTGVLVADDLILTNYHVLNIGKYPDVDTRLEQCEIRFGAEKMEDGGISAGNLVVRLSAKNPLTLYSDIGNLDFALLRLNKPITDNQSIKLAKLSMEPLCVGQSANIVHYPLGGPLQYSLRNNEVVAVENERFYYLSDTQEGSSGSPVFNDDWNMIGIHRASGLLEKSTGNKILEANQGVPLTSILEKIRTYVTL